MDNKQMQDVDDFLEEGCHDKNAAFWAKFSWYMMEQVKAKFGFKIMARMADESEKFANE